MCIGTLLIPKHILHTQKKQKHIMLDTQQGIAHSTVSSTNQCLLIKQDECHILENTSQG